MLDIGLDTSASVGKTAWICIAKVSHLLDRLQSGFRVQGFKFRILGFMLPFFLDLGTQALSLDRIR